MSQSEDFSVDSSEAFFIVAFMEDDDELSMEAVGDLDDPAQREMVIAGLKGLIERIENLHEHDHHTVN